MNRPKKTLKGGKQHKPMGTMWIKPTQNRLFLRQSDERLDLERWT